MQDLRDAPSSANRVPMGRSAMEDQLINRNACIAKLTLGRLDHRSWITSTRTMSQLELPS